MCPITSDIGNFGHILFLMANNVGVHVKINTCYLKFLGDIVSWVYLHCDLDL